MPGPEMSKRRTGSGDPNTARFRVHRNNAEPHRIAGRKPTGSSRIRIPLCCEARRRATLHRSPRDRTPRDRDPVTPHPSPPRPCPPECPSSPSRSSSPSSSSADCCWYCPPVARTEPRGLTGRIQASSRRGDPCQETATDSTWPDLERTSAEVSRSSTVPSNVLSVPSVILTAIDEDSAR